MRYLFVGFLAAAFLCGCKGDDKKAGTPHTITDTTQFTTIQWLDSTSKDYGRITEGQLLEVSFRFRNSGNKPLVIERVQPSCGCTVALQSPEPIPPGGEGQIKASFNSRGRKGANHKTLFVYGNTKDTRTHTLQFVVQVEKTDSAGKKL